MISTKICFILSCQCARTPKFSRCNPTGQEASAALHPAFYPVTPLDGPLSRFRASFNDGRSWFIDRLRHERLTVDLRMGESRECEQDIEQRVIEREGVHRKRMSVERSRGWYAAEDTLGQCDSLSSTTFSPDRTFQPSFHVFFYSLYVYFLHHGHIFNLLCFLPFLNLG